MAGLSATDIDRRIAARVLVARKAAHVTQGDAGRALGVSVAQLQKYEKGSNRLTGGMLQTLADLFGVTVAAFFDPPPSDAAPALALPIAVAEAELLSAAERYVEAKRGTGQPDLRVLAEAA